MPRSSPIQTSFNAGKWGPLLQGRVDLEKYTSACNELKNFIPTVQGPALKRSGTRFLKTVKDQAKKSRLIPFEFSTEQAYVLELYEGGMRVLKDSGAVLEPTVAISNVSDANPVVVTASNSYTNGDEVYITGTAQGQINGRFFTVAAASGSAFSLTGENGTGRATGSGGTASRAYSITNSVGGNSLPWLEAELDAVSFVQNGDLLFLAHPNHPPHKLTRTAHTSWTCKKIDFIWPPFRPENDNEDLLMMASLNEGDGQQLRLRGNTEQALTIWQTLNTAPIVVKLTAGQDIRTLANGDTVYLRDIATAIGLNVTHYTIANLTEDTTGTPYWHFELVGTSAPGHIGTGGKAEKLLSTDSPFTADMVGSYVSLRQPVGVNMPEWKPATDHAAIEPRVPGSAGLTGAPVHYAGNVYQINVSASFNIGQNPPVHDRYTDGFVSGGAFGGGATFKLYNRGTGYGEITSVAADKLSCGIDIRIGLPMDHCDLNPMEQPSSSVAGNFETVSTERWSIGAWSAENGYPRAVAFFEDRLWFAGTNADPQTFWGTRTGEYEDFEEIDGDPSSAVKFTLASSKINAIEWLAGDQQLMIGTRGGEFVASGSSRTEAITASNITVRQQSSYGVKSGVQPRFVDSSLLFVQRAGERLHQLSYSNESDSYIGPDLTALSNDILQPSAAELSYQPAPFRQLWVRLTDGNLATLTYVSDQDVLGWAQLEIGGTGVEVESLASIPHPDGDQDQVWMIVKRTIDSVTKRYIEYLEKPFSSSTTYADAFFVDSGLTYSGSATTTITGLDHLEGQVVKVFADGVVQSDKTVFGGAISITSASKVQVGLGYDARVQTMRLESGAADGTAQGRRKRVQQILLRVDNSSQSVSYGANFDKMDSWDMGAGATYSGDSPSFTMPGGYEREGRISIQHQDPTPFTLVAIMPQLSTESR